MPDKSINFDQKNGSGTTEPVRGRKSGRIAVGLSLALSIAAVILVLLLRQCSTGDAALSKVQDLIPGLSAYEVWLSVGNNGTAEDFLSSIVGEDGESGYIGSDGFSGTSGASAYQLWLDSGKEGTSQASWIPS